MSDDRFWSKVDVRGPDECWPWLASLDSHGYGQFGVGSKSDGTRRPAKAHRVAYELLVGPIPEGLDLDHQCHNEDETCPGGTSCAHRRCVNPAHATPATRKENANRGRGRGGEAECIRAHAFTEENTRIDRSGFRQCRECDRVRDRARRQRERVAA